MARPSDIMNVNTRRALVLVSPLVEAARAASDLDRTALRYVLEACELVASWRLNTTETDRRQAYGRACAAQALALAPALAPTTPQGVALRRSIAAYAAALQTLINGDCVQGLRAAEGAIQSLRPRFALAS